MFLKEKWDNLTPHSKKKVFRIGIIGSFLIFVFIVVVLMSGDDTGRTYRGIPEKKVTLLDDDSYKQVWMADQGAKLRNLENQVARLEKNLGNTNERIDDLSATITRAMNRIEEAIGDAVKKQQDNLSEQGAELEKQMKENIKKEIDVYLEKKLKDVGSYPSSSNMQDGQFPKKKDNNTSSEEVFRQKFDLDKLLEGTGDINDNNAPNSAANNIPNMQGETYSSEADSSVDSTSKEKEQGPPKLQISFDEKVKKKKEEQKQKTTYIPPGSLIGATLLSGLDAPTGGSVQSNPHPVLLMVDKKAILPNEFSMDFRKCFVIGSGYGDMSTERAYIRLETLSCVRNSGSVIESGMYGYIVGPDGKLGVRGRLVSRQGSLLAKSLVAGFFSGLSEALKPERVPQITVDDDTNNNETEKYIAPNLEQVMSSGAYSGASNALERIADFYIDMAEQIFPIVEVNAGTAVEIVATKGVKITLDGTKVKNQVTEGGFDEE